MFHRPGTHFTHLESRPENGTAFASPSSGSRITR